MGIIALTVTILSCLIISYQDFSSRFIHIGSIVALTAALVLWNIKQWHIMLFSFLVNALFMVILFIVLYIYFRFRKGKGKFIDRYIGLGDILVFFAFAFAYNLYNFTVFLIAGCSVCILYWLLSNLVIKKTVIRLPLAGCLTITHLFFMLVGFTGKYDLLTDQYLIFLKG